MAVISGCWCPAGREGIEIMHKNKAVAQMAATEDTQAQRMLGAVVQLWPSVRLEHMRNEWAVTVRSPTQRKVSLNNTLYTPKIVNQRF